MLPVTSPADLANILRAIATVNSLKAGVPGPLRTRTVLAVGALVEGRLRLVHALHDLGDAAAVRSGGILAALQCVTDDSLLCLCVFADKLTKVTNLAVFAIEVDQRQFVCLVLHWHIQGR